MAELRPLVDALISVIAPDVLYAIGLWYHDFSQTTDAEVSTLLERAAASVREP